jgi:Large polyvalent protein-associated domain 7
MTTQEQNSNTPKNALKSTNLNEIIRGEKSEQAPKDSLPSNLTKHFHKDGNSYRSAAFPEKIELVDRGNRMHAYRPVSSFTVSALAQTAQDRGWKSLNVTGDLKFKQRLYVEASDRGISVKGYQPTQKDADILLRRSHRREAEDNPKVQAFSNATKFSQIKAAVKQFPDLAEAFVAKAAIEKQAATIDDPKAARSFADRLNDRLTIAIHRGEPIAKLELRDQDLSQRRDAGQSKER